MGKHMTPNYYIVVADDDPLYRRLWEKILSQFPNSRYRICSTVAEAEDALHKEMTTLLVCDVVMPDKMGFDLATEASKKYPWLQVVLTTGYEAKLSHFNLRDPKFHILYKPYRSVEDIVKWLKHLLAQEDPTVDASEDSWSENDDFPAVMEWKL
jgi:two-component system nitrogen regulation response regulator GlnG